MSVDARLLTLTQWLSPAYPVGAFAFSHGLEAAVAEGWVTDGASLEGWLRDVLEEGSGRIDAILLGLVSDPEVDVAGIEALARAWQPAAERLREAERQGAAFARVTAEVWDLALPPMVLPVALGRAAGLMGLDRSAVTALYLQAFVGNLVSAAQRLMGLGQTEAQAVLARLAPVCLSVAAEAGGKGAGDLWSNAWASDIAAMRHETQEPRLFQS
ncbi:urease accessory protein UreF [Ponticoccus alexandrii]|uniref:Urease accessory protein UreF n=1 Tax=Ponticoccus alexandrii TaxID=1943633 RepID=A0ABX7FCP4_9RHOB|nr:urease accessory UreF family protein [Ponticoccus alexandrii]ETA50920.1 urease accessory protein UreF [Rhodobacteraceae bacterium PD-2]QRF68361.1 urease accessory protein UreF [Ponticoccus alexandrii]